MRTFNAQSAANYAGKSVRTILYWIDNGRLEATKGKRAWEITQEALDEAIGSPSLEERVSRLEQENITLSERVATLERALSQRDT